jgi:hypothetical protein
MTCAIMEGRARDEFVKRRDVRSLNGRDWDGGGGMSNDEFRNMVPLRQLYIPHDNRVIICDPSPDSTFKTPLMSNEWQGPDGGPYTPLYYKPVPGHVLPLAIAPFWYDLDDLLNKTFGKSGNQALRGKVIGVTRNESDAATIKKASDGTKMSTSASMTNRPVRRLGPVAGGHVQSRQVATGLHRR